MDATNKNARIAATLYVLVSLFGVFSLLYVPSKLIVRGNAAATAANILASETLFRAGIVAELFGCIGFLFVVRALYRLLHEVDETQASLMVMLFSLSVPISLVNGLNDLAALTLIRGTDFLAVFDKPQREALAMLFLRLHGQGIGIAAIFWGLWLFPFGILVIRSGFIPRIFGVLLIVNGFAYPAVTLTSFLAPDYVGAVNRFASIAQLGELWIVLWLLIMGVKTRPLAVAAS
jgi:hypothetical protein